MQSHAEKGARKGARVAAAAAILLTFATTTDAFADGFRKHPYLQGLGTDRVQVRFELPSAAPATVNVTGPSELRRSVESKESAFHSVSLPELAPATTYRYEVRAGEAYFSGTFTTAPDDARPFSFLLYGDSRSDAATHAAVVQGMLKTSSDFLVGTGDLTARGDDPRDFDAFFHIERKLLADRCLFTAIGNHELIGIRRGGDVPFLKYFATGLQSGEPRLYDTFRWSNTRFFVLSAMENWTGPERDWLARELEKADTEPGLVHRFAVLHIGPWSSGPHGPNRRMHEAGIPELLRKHRVEAVFSGHDHIYERGEVDGLKYMISGGAGAPLYPVKERLATTGKVEPAHHWVEVNIDGPKVSTRAVRLDGSVIEKCSYQVGEPWSCDVPQGRVTSEGAPPVASVTPAGASRCACSSPGSGTRADAWPLAVASLGLAFAVVRRRGRS